jgi:hypothetical protein
MENLDYGRSPYKAKRPNPFPLYILLAVALLSIAVLFVSIRQNRTNVPSAGAPIGISPSTTSASQPKFDAQGVFSAHVEPVLRQLHAQDDEACQRAIALIHGHFGDAKSGAPAFAAAIIGPLNGIKTTWLASKGVFERWWYEDPQIQPVADHVRWNYEQNVTSGPKIRDVILASIQQLQQDFSANRNEAIQAIGTNIKAADLPVAINVNQSELDEFCEREFEVAMAGVNNNHIAEKAAVGSASAFVLSSAATMLAERGIAFGLEDYIAAAGGATATGVGGGGTIGSMVPGAGTIIGATVGLLAGIGVDAWISHENKKTTIAEVDKSLTQIETSIMNGDGGHIGVDKVFHQAASGQAQELRTRLKEQIQEASQ